MMWPARLTAVKPESHLALCVQHISVCRDPTNASDVYCAHLAFYAGVRKCKRKKIETWSIFLAYHVYSVLLSGHFTMLNVYTQHQKYATIIRSRWFIVGFFFCFLVEIDDTISLVRTCTCNQWQTILTLQFNDSKSVKLTNWQIPCTDRLT